MADGVQTAIPPALFHLQTNSIITTDQIYFIGFTLKHCGSFAIEPHAIKAEHYF